MNRIAAVLAWLAVLGPSPARAAAAIELPLYNFNLIPVVQVFGLPPLGAAQLAAPAQTRLGLHYTVANHFVGESDADEMTLFDGESERVTLALAYGIGADKEIAIEIPYVSHGGGYLDRLIAEYHDAVGLAQHGRDIRPRDLLVYRYRRDGVDLLDVTQAANGLGDVRLSGAIALRRAGGASAHPLAARLTVKLPTGDAQRMLGSGATDIALGLSAACGPLACQGRWSWVGGIGLVHLGTGKMLPAFQKRLVGYGGTGVAWRRWPSVTLKAQIDAHTAFYSGIDLKPFVGPSVQLTVGGTWRWAPRTQLEFALSEDLLTNTAPDVTISVSLRAEF